MSTSHRIKLLLKILSIGAVFGLAFSTASFAVPTQLRAGENVEWNVVSGGGVPMISTKFRVDGTLGQCAIGSSAGLAFSGNSGYWQDFAEGCCTGIRGNANSDPNDVVNIVDVTFLVAYLFMGGTYPPCSDEANVNGVGSINIVDVTAIVNYLFKTLVPPPACP